VDIYIYISLTIYETTVFYLAVIGCVTVFRLLTVRPGAGTVTTATRPDDHRRRVATRLTGRGPRASAAPKCLVRRHGQS